MYSSYSFPAERRNMAMLKKKSRTSPARKRKSILVKDFEQFIYHPSPEIHILDLVLKTREPKIVETFTTYSVFESRR